MSTRHLTGARVASILAVAVTGPLLTGQIFALTVQTLQNLDRYSVHRLSPEVFGFAFQLAIHFGIVPSVLVAIMLLIILRNRQFSRSGISCWAQRLRSR